jgi:hypothetical protein
MIEIEHWHHDRPDWTDALLKFYKVTFEPLERLAAQRHVMTDDEFRTVMADRRVIKYLARGDGDEIVGLATMSNDLESMPLISPAFFKARYPVEYRLKAIYYVGFVGCADGARAFEPLIHHMIRDAAPEPIIAVDVCTYNAHTRQMPRVIEDSARRIDPGVTARLLDRQSFWSYHFTNELARGSDS